MAQSIVAGCRAKSSRPGARERCAFKLWRGRSAPKWSNVARVWRGRSASKRWSNAKWVRHGRSTPKCWSNANPRICWVFEQVSKDAAAKSVCAVHGSRHREIMVVRSGDRWGGLESTQGLHHSQQPGLGLEKETERRPIAGYISVGQLIPMDSNLGPINSLSETFV